MYHLYYENKGWYVTLAGAVDLLRAGAGMFFQKENKSNDERGGNKVRVARDEGRQGR